jgi:hypothetical protein
MSLDGSRSGRPRDLVTILILILILIRQERDAAIEAACSHAAAWGQVLTCKGPIITFTDATACASRRVPAPAAPRPLPRALG